LRLNSGEVNQTLVELGFGPHSWWTGKRNIAATQP